MWLSNSSVGRKFIMALTGAFLVLFVTFHCLMNAVAICWPAAYNVVCEFLGANWYALAGTALIAVFVILHIIYACILTIQNRKARGSERYALNRRPAGVEWSSQNMFVLGVVILAFLVVHLIQFWAKMQLVEVLGKDSVIPGAAGTLFLEEAFSTPWTLIVYMIGFIALWFHLTHGFWSMFQSIGWDNARWMPRLKKISLWWVGIVVVLFAAEGIVFTVNAHRHTYLTNPTLREQYQAMVADEMAKELNMPAMAEQIKAMPFEQFSTALRQQDQMISQQLEMTKGQDYQAMLQQPGAAEQLEEMKKAGEAFGKGVKFLDYLQKYDDKPVMNMPSAGQPN